MVAFSIDIRSLGRLSLFQRATVAPSVRRERTSRPCVMGIGTWGRCRVGVGGMERRKGKGKREERGRIGSTNRKAELSGIMISNC